MHLSNKRISLNSYYSTMLDYAEMLRQLIVRDLKVRYSRGWTVAFMLAAQPLVYLVGLLLVFYKLNLSGGMDSTHVVISVGIGMSHWYMMAQAMVQGHKSILEQRDLLNKVYFPRMVLPVAKSVVTGLESLLLWLPMSIAVLCLVGGQGIFLLLWMLVFFGFTALCVSATALLTTRYQMLRNLIPILLQVGIIVSPVGYRTQAMIGDLPMVVQLTYGLNPMVFWIESGRALSGLPMETGPAWTVSALASVALLLTALFTIPSLDHNLSDAV